MSGKKTVRALKEEVKSMKKIVSGTLDLVKTHTEIIKDLQQQLGQQQVETPRVPVLKDSDRYLTGYQ